MGGFVPVWRDQFSISDRSSPCASKNARYHVSRHVFISFCRCARADGHVRPAAHVLEAGGRWKSLHDAVGQSECVLPESGPSRDDVLTQDGRLIVFYCIVTTLFRVSPAPKWTAGGSDLSHRCVNNSLDSACVARKLLRRKNSIDCFYNSDGCSMCFARYD